MKKNIILIILGTFLLIFSIKTCSTSIRYVNNGVETAYQEYKPEELLRKYEWFKDASASLDAKLANLHVYYDRFNLIKESYGKDSLNRNLWKRDDIQQWNIWMSEYSGITASYNNLCSQYNSEMSKFNWRFCNKGTMPQGAAYDKVLPKEYKPYLYQ